MMENSSSCFICGLNIVNRNSPRRKTNNLKELVFCLCNLLQVNTDKIGEIDWQLPHDLQRGSICCEKCTKLMQNVERTHEIVLKSQEFLKSYLEEVEGTIIKSQSLRLQTSLWGPFLFKIRNKVLKKNNVTTIRITNNGVSGNDHDDNFVEEEFVVKAEYPEYPHNTDYLKDDLQNDWNGDAVVDAYLHRELVSIPNIPNVTEVCNDVVKVESSEPFSDKISGNDSSKSSKLVSLKSISPSASRKKRKQTEVDSTAEDKEEEVDSSNLGRRVSSSRTAKKSAKEVLKTYISDDEEENGDSGNKDNDRDYDGDGTEVSRGPISPSEVANRSSETSTKINSKESQNSSLKVPKRTEKRRKPRTDCAKRTFFPLVYAKENLYLYRGDTYFQKTYTHLQCKAYQCNFQTDFDYYSSFQVIKKHFDEAHDTRKHRQQTPHPCLLCDTAFKNRKDFWSHNSTTHASTYNLKTARGLCECCLTTTCLKYTRDHMFSHKNLAEKATADKKPRKKPEALITERKFRCDHPNCPAAFKVLQGLKRHKDIHLPRELRKTLIVCTECGKQLYRDQLSSHMERIHHPESVTRYIVCSFCDKRYLYRDRYQYELHLKRHTADKSFLCPECGKSYFDNPTLQAHIKQVHREVGPFPCEFCERVYTKWRSLRHHVERKHPDKVKLKKEKSRFYPRMPAKKEIMLPLQKFPCEKCDTVCSQRQVLKRHMERKHGQEGEVVGGSGNIEKNPSNLL